MNESIIEAFWNNNPCGETLIESQKIDIFEDFIQQYDQYRYRTEPHILKCLDKIDFKDKKILEIGLGQGADSEQIIKRGGIWSGLDLTQESVERVKLRLKLRKLDYQDIQQGSALQIPFKSQSFDLVFSHGVLHHIPNIQKAQEEIHRVLAPNGKLVVMLYAKRSLNYLTILTLRRLGMLSLYYLRPPLKGKYQTHYEEMNKVGLKNYLNIKNFIHKNTDGPLNPYSKVYDRRLVEEDFHLFTLENSFKQFMHAPPLPIQLLPFETLFGWHLWCYLKPKHIK
jgi:ubiquinone/menaquinone biosynthesis C-methylase UbiE